MSNVNDRMKPRGSSLRLARGPRLADRGLI
jgi:hypothetical protein